MDVRLNRHAWLEAMRSGIPLKGTYDCDKNGRPYDIESPGCCAVGLMYNMFTLPGEGPKVYWKRLGVGQKEVAWIQQDLNDCGLSFPEIAEEVARELGWE